MTTRFAQWISVRTLLFAIVGCLTIVLCAHPARALQLATETPSENDPSSEADGSRAKVEGVGERVGPATRGEQRLLPPQFSQVYRKKWALIVGINYEGRDDVRSDRKNAAALPPLKNAQRDATEFAQVLKDYYGYQDENVFLVLEEQATKNTIEDKLGELMNSELVNEEDSVLVFFAGHGARRGGGTSFLAYDVKLAQGVPTAQHMKLQEDIVQKLQESPAKHKLLILDHCHSGDVFNRSFQPPTRQGRDDRTLVRETAFQAMASCRAGQVALDEGELIKGHSPFTASLIDGLRRLPANGNPSDPIGATKILKYIASTFSAVDQLPDCRNLISTDGEFFFLSIGPRRFQ